MYLRLEKIDPPRNRWRWYVLSVQPTLFAEWALIREWGRVGNDSGQSATVLYTTERKALGAGDILKAARVRRGYATQAEQLDLPFWS